MFINNNNNDNVKWRTPAKIAVRNLYRIEKQTKNILIDQTLAKTSTSSSAYFLRIPLEWKCKSTLGIQINLFNAISSSYNGGFFSRPVTPCKIVLV